MVYFCVDGAASPTEGREAAWRRDDDTAIPAATLAASSFLPLLRRVAAEYREMPGLSLTIAQASRLWGIDRDTCVAVLQALVADGQLRCTSYDRYCVAGSLERVTLRAGDEPELRARLNQLRSAFPSLDTDATPHPTAHSAHRQDGLSALPSELARSLPR